MATMATLLRAVSKASLASRAAAMASRSARAAGVAAAAILGSGVLCPLKSCPARGYVSTKLPRRFPSSVDYAHLPDDAKTPTDKDLQSDEAAWALYERWCKAFNKQRDHAEMARRFKIFKHYATLVHDWNTYVPEDPEEAAIYLQKREKAKLPGQWHVPFALGPLSDGGDPFLRGCDYKLLKRIEEREACSAVKDVIVE